MLEHGLTVGADLWFLAVPKRFYGANIRVVR